jgi:hypothetical protein
LLQLDLVVPAVEGSVMSVLRAVRRSAASRRYLAAAVLAAAVLLGLSVGSASASGYFSFGDTTYSPGSDANTAYDLCSYNNYYYTDSVFTRYSSPYYSGTAAIIASSGSWLASSIGAMHTNWATVSSTYYDTVKKDYVKNNSSSTYSAYGMAFYTTANCI